MIKLAIFDMDGTVFESHLNWVQIKKNLNIKSNILKEIYQGSRVNQKKLKRLERYEEENTLKTKPIKGIHNFLNFLKNNDIPSALVTNNNRKNSDFLLKKFNLSFDTVMAREMKLWKPSPEPFFYVMEQYLCKKGETISIGDSHYDVMASRQAGIENIFIIKNKRELQINDVDDIIFFGDFYELKSIFEQKFLGKSL